MKTNLVFFFTCFLGIIFLVGCASNPGFILLKKTDLNVDSGVFVVDANKNKVGINTKTPNAELNVVGDVNITGIVHFQKFHTNDFNTVSGGLLLLGAKTGTSCTTVCANHGLGCNQSVTVLGVVSTCDLTAMDYVCWCE